MGKIEEREADLARAAAILEAGGLVAIPTETVYGLAANALDANAVTKIFEAKGRPNYDPLIVHAANAEAAFLYARMVPEIARKLAAAFWPGPLTLVLKKKAQVPDNVTANLDSVGLRVPNHPLTLALLSRLSFPLAAPSANPFGYVSPTTALHVAAQLADKVEFILDGGPCEVGLESTIVAVGLDNSVRILRLGGLDIEAIERVIGREVDEVRLGTSVPKENAHLVDNQTIEAPGQLSSHYSPRVPLFIEPMEEIWETMPHLRAKLHAIRMFTPTPLLPLSAQTVLAPDGDLNEAARKLFAVLRELDSPERQISAIVAELAPEEGIGMAINDRLKRAAAKK